MSTYYFVGILLLLSVEVTGFYCFRNSVISIVKQRGKIWSSENGKKGRYDVIKDFRYQEELQDLRNLKTKELIEACKQLDINVNGVLDREELEYRLIVHRLTQRFGEDSRTTAKTESSLSKRAYIMELDNEIQKVKLLSYEQLREEMFHYNISDLPLNDKEKDEVIVLIAKERIKERQEFNSPLRATRIISNSTADSEETKGDSGVFVNIADKEEGDDADLIIPTIALNQTALINDSINFLKSSLDGLGKFTEGLAFTDSEKVAKEYSSKITLTPATEESDDQLIKELFEEATKLSSLREAKEWIQDKSRDTVVGLLSLIGDSPRKYQFTSLAELREIFINHLLKKDEDEELLLVDEEEEENNLETIIKRKQSEMNANKSKQIRKNVPDIKIILPQKKNNTMNQKRKQKLLEDILFIEKSLFNTIFFSFFPRLFQSFISTITIVMNQIIGLFAADAIDWSEMNLPKFIHSLPNYSKKFAGAEYPIIMVAQMIQRLSEVTFAWVGSDRYPASTISSLVCSYTILTKGGVKGFIKTLLVTKFITSILNQLKFESSTDMETTDSSASSKPS